MRRVHTDLTNLIKGLHGALRTATGHALTIHWSVSQQDALDILTTISLVHCAWMRRSGGMIPDDATGIVTGWPRLDCGGSVSTPSKEKAASRARPEEVARPMSLGPT